MVTLKTRGVEGGGRFLGYTRDYVHGEKNVTQRFGASGAQRGSYSLRIVFSLSSALSPIIKYLRKVR